MNSGKMTVHPDALEPGTRVGRWRVVESLGVGGQGAVYRVEDMDHPGNFHALKLALSARDGRAEREVALMKTRVAHPHVVGFHGCVRWPHPHEGGMGFVMDWVPGIALHQWAETGDTTFRQLTAAGATVALTLGELHARGVLHRDLKPEHILLRESDGQPVLLDFGVAWFEGAAPLTTGPLPPATLYLLSPEAIRFLWDSPRHPGERYAFQPGDDLYALGVCLYRATTGHYPFSEWLPPALLQYAIVHQRVPVPLDVNPRVPRALSEVIVRLLAKNPQERYASAAEVHAALVDAASRAPGEWDIPIFDTEEVPPEQEGDKPQRCILRPERPRPSWTFSALPPLPHAAREERRRHWPRRLALATAVLLAMVPMTLARRDARVDGSWVTDVHVGPSSEPSTEAPLPMKNQKLAPCTAKLEVEVSGACWLRLWDRPPNCPPQTVAYGAKCLWPVPKPHPGIPTSVDAGTPEAR